MIRRTAMKEKMAVIRAHRVRALEPRKTSPFLFACAFVTMLTCVVNGAQSASAQNGVWIEPIEIYELPWDPEWRSAALGASFPTGFRRRAEDIAERRRNLSERVGRSNKSDTEKSKEIARGSAEIQQTIDGHMKGLRASAARAVPLTVVRAWNGISRNELVLSFGRGQRATVDRLRTGRPLLVVIDQAKPGDDIQAVRHTVGSIRPSSSVPSDFVRLADAPQELAARGFGEVDSRAQREDVVIRAVKDPTPGSGALTLELAAPPSELGIDTAYPWYAEFKLFELGKDGLRAREVRFEGPDSIVSVPTSRGMQPVSDPRDDSRTAARSMRARGRVEVKSPVPWGYEAVVVKWFGVAAKDRLVAGSGAKPAANRPIRESDTAVPAEPAEPLEETAPPALPEEPQTPDIPGTRL